jgi:c(7)-type cytochrome triheme protein
MSQIAKSYQCLVLAAVVGATMLLSPSAFAASGGDITFTPPNTEPVHFSHDYHLKQRGLQCIACHNPKFLKGTGYEMKKETITKNDFCGTCHNGMKAFDVANKKNCIRCHSK